jgi:serine/arginine repetitive matrix protein 2
MEAVGISCSMSYNNIGLATARGSATNGFVSRNIAAARPTGKRQHTNNKVERPPNTEILDHKRKRAKLAAMMEMEERMRSAGESDEAIEVALKELYSSYDGSKGGKQDSHEQGVAKAKVLAKVGAALSIIKSQTANGGN